MLIIRLDESDSEIEIEVTGPSICRLHQCYQHLAAASLCSSARPDRNLGKRRNMRSYWGPFRWKIQIA